MRKKIIRYLPLLVTVFVICGGLRSQSNFNFNCARDTTITGCASSCLTLQAVIPDLHGQTTSYTINPASTIASCLPATIPPGGTGTPTNLSIDDRYSSVINMGFSFPFFGTAYTQVVASTNGYVTFDVTRAGLFSHWSIINGTTPQNLPSTFYDMALIMGPYHDLDPSVSTSPGQKIQYSTVGTAPHRKWILSFYRVPLFQCNPLIENTHQIILYESTGIVEVFIYSKQICTSWNQGRAMIGMQNAARNQAVMVTGRRASDPPWGTLNMNETWRFVPSGGPSLFRRVELYNLAGTLISTGTTTNPGNGNLQASFSNVCPPAGVTPYIVKSVYTKIDDPNVEVFGLDTVRVTRNITSNVTATAATSPANCSNNNGSITVTASNGTAPYQYSLDNVNFQPGNTFTGLAQNTYNVTVQDANSCNITIQATVSLQNNLTLNAGNDTTICFGASFTPVIVSNGNSFTWSPIAGVSNPSIVNPLLSPQSTTQYTVTATLGICSLSRTKTVTVVPGAFADAGPDAAIVAGDVYLIPANATAGTYVWTPSTGLSATNILRPNASPLTTTTYTLSVTTPLGCSASDNVVITVIPYCVKPMEAFTPNGDGINDRWLISTDGGACLTNATAQVFNRYGAKVFEAQDYKNTWDGTYKGKPLPDGTYYYVISFRLINGKRVILKGNLTILR